MCLWSNYGLLIEFSQSFVLLLSLVSGFGGKAVRAEQKGAEGRGGGLYVVGKLLLKVAVLYFHNKTPVDPFLIEGNYTCIIQFL
jgi:hypothetical protein